MKHTLKWFGFIALAAIIGFAMAGCENPTDPGSKSLIGNVSFDNNSPKVGDTITATYSPGNGTGIQTWQWFRVDGTDVLIPGVTTNAYTATAADVGKKIKVLLSFADQIGSVSATTTNAVAPAVPNSGITYTAIQTGGTDNTANTTAINFTFSAAVSGLTANDITVTNGTGSVTKGALSGSGTSWSLAVTVTAAGNVTVGIAKSGIEAVTKPVTVYKQGQSVPTLTGITAVYTQGSTIIYPDTPLDSLKAGLSVTAVYSNSTTQTATDYALSGTLTVGTSAVTVTYEGKTTTFNVTVTAGTADITYTAIQTGGTDNTANTTAISFTFSASVTGLTANDITVTDGTGSVTKGALSGSGTSWTLGVTVITAGNVTIAIAKTGIEAGTKNVTVYKQGQSVPTLTGITAVYTQGSATVYPDTPLDDLKAGLTVTAAYSNGTTQTATDYALSGTLTVGTSAVTVTYEGKETTFNVTVTAVTNSDITYTAAQTGGTDGTADSAGILFTFSGSVSGLTANEITVANGTGSVTKGALSGSGTSWSLAITVVTAGNVTVSISKSGIEAATKSVAVFKAGQTAPTLTGITAVYTQGSATVYPDTPLDDIKAGLTVTAAYSNSTTQPVTDYALSGTLTVGASAVTVTYEGKTTTFNVTVTAVPNSDITYTAAQTGGADNTADTTAINFTFSASITGLTANDITITDGNGSVTKGTLSGSGTSWTLGVTVITAGNVTVGITKTGIEAETKNVPVYKAGQTAPTLTSITLNTDSVKKDYNQNETLDLSGLVVTANYSDSTSAAVSYTSTSPANGATLSTTGTITVTVNYTEGTITKSNTFNVTVTAPKTLTGITLNTDSVKKAYNQNETLNLTGLVVTANYSDSTSAAVSYTSTSPANGATLSTAGTITVTVNYTEGTITKSNTFNVTVTAPKTLTGITLNTDSVKKDYNQNETLNLTGLVVTANYSDSTSAAVSYTSTSPANGAALSTTGTITITVSYTEGAVTQSNTFTVTVATTTVTVTFDTDGGSNVNSQTVETGGYINRPANPTKRGYNFVDWYTSAEYEYLFNFNVPITSSRTAYAKWVEGVPVITTDTLPNGEMNAAYSQTLTATGAAPITWSIDTGSLPGGLTIASATGVISGTPTTPGTSDFTVKATNAEGNDTKPLSITVTPPSGTLLTENQWANGSIATSGGRQQWFTFTATASTQYIHIETGTLTNLYVQVYDSSGATVGSETNFYSSTPSTSRTLTTGDTYYIRVRPYSNSYSGTYQIGFGSIAPPGAIPLTENQWADGNLPTSSSQQWFVFTATASMQYIHIERGTLTSLYVQVYDSSGATVGSETNLYSSTPSTSRTLTTGDTYYIRVRPYSNSYSGTYRIAFGSIVPPSAIPLTENIWADGNNTQWFTFTATASTQYIHADVGTLTDMYVQVYDSSGAEVGSETYLYSSTNTSRTLTEGETYYIRVRQYDSSYSGTYRIAFNTSTTAPPVQLPSDAITITENQWADGSLSANGQQWFSFTATASTQYIYAEFGTLNSSIYVQVYDSSGVAVGSETSLSNYYEDTPTTSRTLTAGQTYYIRVRPSRSYGVTYRIAFNTSTTAPPVQLPSDAIPLTENQWSNGSLTTSARQQWFTFTATAPTQYLHAAFGTIISGTYGGIYMQVYNSSGAAVGSTRLYSSTTSTSRSLTEGQTYYIRVRQYDISYTGTYQIGFNTTFYPPGTTFNTLTENQWANGNLPTSGSQQWFTFTATASTQYLHAGFGTIISGTYGGIYMQVYDSSGTAVGSQTRLYSSTTNTSRTLTEGETYYIRVTPYSSDYNTGTYWIGFTTSTTAPTS